MEDPGRSQKDLAHQVRIWESKLNQIPLLSLDKCGIPPKYAGCSLDNFKGNSSLINEIKEYSGGGMVLTGGTGAGKTHLSVSVIKSLYENRWAEYCNKNIERIKAEDRPDYNYSFQPMFITAPDFLLKIRDTFKDGCRETEGSIIDRYAHFQLLVLDDLGSEKPTEHTIMALYVLIDRRDSQLKDTVITTNLSLPQIETRLNSRIASRLSSWDWKQIDMPDYRKNK